MNHDMITEMLCLFVPKNHVPNFDLSGMTSLTVTDDQTCHSDNDNPWEVSNLGVFLFYCCPECEYRCQEVTDFETHGLRSHPKAKKAIGRMKDVVGHVKNRKGHHFCELCGKYMTTATKWRNHMRVTTIRDVFNLEFQLLEHITIKPQI